MTQAWPLHQEPPVEYPEGASPVAEDEAQLLDAQLDRAWQRDAIRRLSREFTFGDSRMALAWPLRTE